MSTTPVLAAEPPLPSAVKHNKKDAGARMSASLMLRLD